MLHQLQLRCLVSVVYLLLQAKVQAHLENQQQAEVCNKIYIIICIYYIFTFPFDNFYSDTGSIITPNATTFTITSSRIRPTTTPDAVINNAIIASLGGFTKETVR